MSRKLLALIIIMAIGLIIAGCSSKSDNGNGPQIVPAPRLIAENHQDPTFAGALTSSVWDTVTAIDVIVGTNGSYNSPETNAPGTTVKMKALVADDSLIYIWAKWPDGTESNRFGQMRASWVNNSFQFSDNLESDSQIYNEDRFFIIFDNGGTNGADCASFCHAIADTSTAGKRFYGAAGDMVDIWHWKANRTGLAKKADDMFLTTTTVKPDDQATTNDSLYFKNWSTFNSRPVYMHDTGPSYTGPALLESEAPSQTFTPFDYISNTSWGDFPPGQQPVGKILPGYYVYDVSGDDGSRWDVQAQAMHDGSNWTLIFRRALSASGVQDVNLNLTAPDSLEISIGIGDNSGVMHNGIAPFYLIFQ